MAKDTALCAIRIPLPPPPETALIMTGKPIFWATFVGMLPQLFILTTIASGLEKIIDQNLEAPGIIEIITNPAIYYPLMIFACLIILTIFLRKIFYKS